MGKSVRPQRSDMKEKLLVKACLDYLLNLEQSGAPVCATRTNSGKIMTKQGYAVQLCRNGFPDIIACIRGQFVGIECKTDHKQTGDQIRVENLIQNSGGQYWIVRQISDLRRKIADQIGITQKEADPSSPKFNVTEGGKNV